VAFDRRTIWRNPDEFLPPDVTGVRIPAGITPDVLEAAPGEPTGVLPIPEPVTGVRPATLASPQFNIEQALATQSVDRGFLRGLGLPEDWLPEKAPAHDESAEMFGTILGEGLKFGLLSKFVPFKGAIREPLIGALSGGIRQIGAEEPSLSGVAEEAALIGAPSGIVRAAAPTVGPLLKSAKAAEKIQIAPKYVKPSQMASAEAKLSGPLVDAKGNELAVTVGFFGYTPEVAQSLQKAWGGLVDRTWAKTLDVMPKKIHDFVNVFSRGSLPPLAKQIIRDREKGIILGRRHAQNLGRAIREEVPEKYQFEVYKTLDPTHIGDLGEFPREYRPLVQAAREKIDALGLEATTLNLLDPQVYYRNVGEYLGRYYRPKIETKKFFTDAFRKWFRLGVKGERFRHRILKTGAERERAGLITDPAYAVSNTISDLTYDIETAKAFRRIAQNPEWVVGKVPLDTKGWKWVPGQTKELQLRYGDLANKWVRNDIFDEINTITETRGQWARLYDRLLGSWKYGKTALNPATHGRNIFSNVILADFAGLSPLRLDVYAKAAREYLKKGPLYQEALEQGLFGADWLQAEVKSLFSATRGKKSMFDIIGESWMGKVVKKPGQIYQGEEHFFKMAVYAHQRSMGATVEQAARHAHKYLFDYNDLAPVLKKLRRSPIGGPFLSFTAKALPVIMETAVKHPFRVGKYYVMFRAMNEYGKTMIGMDDDEYNAMKHSLPPWRRSGWNILLPFRDKEDKPILWDLTYNLPWGDIAEQGTFIPVPVLGAVVERFVGTNPFARVPIEIAVNKNIFRDKELFTRDLDRLIAGKVLPPGLGGRATEAVLSHAGTQFAPGIAVVTPPLISAAAGKPLPSGEKPDPFITTLNKLFGLKFASIDIPRGEKIKRSTLDNKRKELIKKVYRIQFDQSLTPEERESELNKLRAAMEKLRSEWEKLGGSTETPTDTGGTTVDRRNVWR